MAGPITLKKCISAITNKLVYAVNNDHDEACNVGFATARGRLLAKLAPMMFLSAQSSKTGCPWPLIKGECHSVWLTVAAVPKAPPAMDLALCALQASNKCDPTVDLTQISDEQPEGFQRWTTSRRPAYCNGANIPPIDDADETH